MERSKDKPDDAAGRDRLGKVRPMVHDEDERPSREDRDYGQTIFTRRPVPLPRFLTGRKKKRD
jgi:hypothetical protein